MPTRDPLPEPWRSALEPKGVTTKRGLATKTGVSPQTAKRLIDGMGRPSVDTVAAVAEALFNGDRDKVWELAGYEHADRGDWQLPPEASLLNDEQRAAVVAVVRAMLPPGARHLTAVDDKSRRRQTSEPSVTPDLVEVSRLRAVAADGDPGDAAVVEALAKLERFEQTGRLD